MSKKICGIVLINHHFCFSAAIRPVFLGAICCMFASVKYKFREISKLEITFWGTRGSIANACQETIRYGGNTSCVELRSNSGTVVVLDCGTGGFRLGQALLNAPDKAKRGHLLISHTHWDHIQGIPFFAPLFYADQHWDIYAPHGLNKTLKETLAGQMNYSYSPITPQDMGANIEHHELVEGVFTIDDIHVQTQFLNHPALTLGYRLEVDGASVVYACDHEPISKKAIPSEAELLGKESHHIEFLRDADIVIHDAQYLADEYEDKVGWGHSTVEYAVAVCKQAGVKKLVFTHHEPTRDDAAIDTIVNNIRESLSRENSPLEVEAAAECQTFKVVTAQVSDKPSARYERDARTQSALSKYEHTVLLTSVRAEPFAELDAAMRAENIQLLSFDDIGDLYANPPSLIIMDSQTPAHQIISLKEYKARCKEEGSAAAPIVSIAYPGENDRGVGLVEDWMVWPFSEQYARAKLRAWLLRASFQWQPARIPDNEEERLSALFDLGILRTGPEERFDRITRLAKKLFDVPIALISLVDRDTQWFKSCIGLDVDETPREVAFCAHAILEDAALIVTDTLLDERFADNPLVTGPPNIRFYAGCTIRTEGNHALGTLCLIDTRPRFMEPNMLKILGDLANLVEQEISTT